MPRFPGFPVLLVLLSLPTAAAIVPGPEIAPVSTVIAPAAFSQYAPRIAAAGGGYLAVWGDSAATATGAIHATRIAPDGTPIDARLPLRIAGAGAHADVTSDGRRYLVVWNEAPGIAGRFVEPDGTMSAPFPITHEAGRFYFPQVAFNGSEFLVAWTQNMLGVEEVGAAFVDANGQITRRVDLGHARPASLKTAIAAMDGVFHVATVSLSGSASPNQWTAEIGITPIREPSTISRRIVAGTIDVTSSSRPVNVQAASRASDAMFAWSDDTTTFTMRVTAAGFEDVQSFAGDLQVLLADDGGYAVVYDDPSGRWVRRVGSATATPLPLLPRESAAVAGADGLIVLSVMVDDVYVQRLDDGAYAPLTVAARHQVAPAIAGSGALRLAAWIERIDDRLVIAAARIGPGGTALDPDGIEIGPAIYQDNYPHIAAAPGQWLVVWHQIGRVVGVRVALDGTVLDPEPLVIADQIYYPDQIVPAWDGSRYVVVFLNGVPNRLGGSFAVAAVHVTADGVVEPPMIQASPFGAIRTPTISAGDDGSLVVWRSSDGGISGSLLSDAGTVTPVAFPMPARFRERDIDVAWNGRTWLVAAAEQPDHIVWFFVSPTGVVTPAPVMAYLPYTPSHSVLLDVEPLGDGFLVVYGSHDDGTIYAAAINGDGYVSHGPAAVATTTVYDERIGAAGSMIVYARPTDPLRGRLSRVFVRELAITSNPPKRRAMRR